MGARVRAIVLENPKIWELEYSYEFAFVVAWFEFVQKYFATLDELSTVEDKVFVEDAPVDAMQWKEHLQVLKGMMMSAITLAEQSNCEYKRLNAAQVAGSGKTGWIMPKRSYSPIVGTLEH